MAEKPIKTVTKASQANAAPPKSESKQNMVLGLLRRAKVASLAEITTATDWQTHSVRGALNQRLEIEVVSEKGTETGERRYFVAALKSCVIAFISQQRLALWI